MSDLAILVVTYNSADVLPGLLDSLEAGLAGVPNRRVLIIDNDSHDDTLAVARAHPARPEVLPTGTNAGFAAAVNFGFARLLPDETALILNPDIRLAPGAARTLLDAAGQPGAGVCAPLMLDPDGSTAPSVRRDPSLLTAWSEAVLGGRLAARLRLGENVLDPARYRNGGTIAWATGAALCVSPAARAAVPRWREDYFLYSEEVEYQRRVRAAGLAVRLVPQARVFHIGGQYRVRPRLYAILTANRIRDYAAHHGPVATRLFQLAILMGEALRAPRAPVHRAGFVAALHPFAPPAEYLAARPHQGARA